MYCIKKTIKMIFYSILNIGDQNTTYVFAIKGIVLMFCN